MFGPLKERLSQGHRTMAYPNQPAVLPDRFHGLPTVDRTKCVDGCTECREVCPVSAMGPVWEGERSRELTLDMGACIFCNECATACPTHAIEFTRNHQLAARDRSDLIVADINAAVRPAQLDPARLRLFGRSLRLRQVSAGGCNACEADTNVLNTLAFDLARFGIQFVASPRHADGILVTGPVTKNMELALRKTYDAVPSPKIVIATGACAISGGLYAIHEETCAGINDIVPVDLYIPGCPPHPLTILDGLLRLLDKLPKN